MKAIKKYFFVLSLVAVVLPAHAQWAVFDAANFVKNTVSSSELIIGEAQRASQILNQQMQIANQLEHLKQIGEAIPKHQVDDVTANISNLRQFISQASVTYGDLNRAQGMMEGRMREWSMSGLSWQQYVDLSSRTNQARGEAATFLRQQEVEQLERVARQAEGIQRSAQAIGGISGSRDGLQLMNNQLNMLLGQTNDMLRMTTAARQAQTESMAEQVAKQQRDLQDADELKRRQTDQRKKSSEDINSLRGFNPFSTVGGR